MATKKFMFFTKDMKRKIVLKLDAAEAKDLGLDVIFDSRMFETDKEAFLTIKSGSPTPWTPPPPAPGGWFEGVKFQILSKKSKAVGELKNPIVLEMEIKPQGAGAGKQASRILVKALEKDPWIVVDHVPFDEGDFGIPKDYQIIKGFLSTMVRIVFVKWPSADPWVDLET